MNVERRLSRWYLLCFFYTIFVRFAIDDPIINSSAWWLSLITILLWTWERWLEKRERKVD